MSDQKPIDPEKFPDDLSKKLFYIVMVCTGLFFGAAYLIFIQ